MKMTLRIVLMMVLGCVGMARAEAASNASFEQSVQVDKLRTLTVQHAQVLKTLDTFSRQMLSEIYGRSSIGGSDPVYTVLDMVFRPEQYVSANVIKVKNAPLRADLSQLDSLDMTERLRIRREGRVSLALLMRPEVGQFLQQQQSTAVFKAKAIDDLVRGASNLQGLGQFGMPLLRIIPPATTNTREDAWHNFTESMGTAPGLLEVLGMAGHSDQLPPELPNYNEQQKNLLGQALGSMVALRAAWRAQDAAQVNEHIAMLTDVLPKIHPAVYPSLGKRTTEVIYNRLTKMTMPGAALYFVAFVLFLLSARSGVSRMRLWGLRFLVLGFAVHTIGIGVRWWLVQTSAGSWFEGIPIKNQFESVLFSAWFGCAVGLVLELWRSRGIFGAAASFVGWMSLVAIFVAPYVAGREIGGEIGQVAGVLMSYWLYLHVTIVTASYALIGMGFLLSLWWLFLYMKEFKTIRRVPAHQLSADSVRLEAVAPGGGAVAMNLWQTLATVLFVRPVRSEKIEVAREGVDEGTAKRFLATLDACNLVVLQLAFWLLGVGIVLGAVWADESWGRPWGWDPKETFALVTWIVYLVVVHVRVATKDKAWWTAVLSIIGFIIMLWNWIGVNFFLVGLHSYA